MYSIIPNTGAGDFTFTRASTATRVNSAGLIESVANNIPRLDYTNGSCPSWLLEPQRTNLLLRSEEFDNASWTKVRTTITSNSTAAPDGAISADSISCNETSNSGCFIRQTTVLATERTTSIFVKPNTAEYFQIHRDFGSGVVFDLSNGTIKQSAGATGTITAYPNGWYRCTATFNVSGLSLFIIGNASMTVTTWTSTINQSLFIWGAQLEAGSNATSYIPTSGSALTRLADAPTLTGASALIGQQEGTIVFDYVAGAATSDDLCVLNAYVVTNNVYLLTTPNLRLIIYHNSLNLSINSSLNIVANTRYRIVARYKSGDTKIWVNGVLVATNTTAFTFSGALNDIRLSKTGTFLGAQPNLLNEFQLQPVLTDAESLALSQIPA
jgi:hypothetical protein